MEQFMKWPLPLSFPTRRQMRERTATYVFALGPQPGDPCPPMPEPPDYLDIREARVEIREIPCFYPSMTSEYGHEKWEIVCEYQISEFPVDRFFLIGYWCEHVGRENDIIEMDKWFLFCGLPTLGIGNREIPFEMPEITWDWVSFRAKANIMGNIIEVEMDDPRRLPKDLEVLTAIFRLKDWNPRRPKVE